MADIIAFPGPATDPEIDRLIDLLEDAGLTVGIIRTSNNWKGELAFSMLGAVCRNTPDVLAAMSELNVRFINDPALRQSMYQEFFGIGALYYEASTSSALAFHEVESGQ